MIFRSFSFLILDLAIIPLLLAVPGHCDSGQESMVTLFPSTIWDIVGGESVTLQEAYQSAPYLLLIPSVTPADTHLAEVRTTRTPWGSIDLTTLIYGDPSSIIVDSLEDLMASGGIAVVVGRHSLPRSELNSLRESLIAGEHPFGEIEVIHDLPVLMVDAGWKLEGVIYRRNTIIDILLSPGYSLEDLETVASSIIEQIHGARSGGYRYLYQELDCTLQGSGDNLSVTHRLNVLCSEGPITTINLSLPYGDKEILERGIRVFDIDQGPILRRARQTPTQTTVTLALPQSLRTGENVTLVLKYQIRDLPGDLGISRPAENIADKSLGKWDEKVSITYRPMILHNPVDELFVRIIMPLDYLPLDWEPLSDACKSYEPRSARVGVAWHLESDIPVEPGFRVLIARGEREYTLSILLFVALGLGLLVLVISDFFRRRNRGFSPDRLGPQPGHGK